jgi:tetratricopeptide (TPR) repeat protein
MYSNHTCPQCGTPISMERMLGSAVVCTCGWSGNKSHFEPPKRHFHIKKILTALSFVGLGFVIFEGKKWGKNYPERVYYQVSSALKMTTAKDEARMAYVCQKLEKHQCSADAYTKALAKSPKSYDLAGALGVELTKIEEYDRAILTFQNFFSHKDGDDVHKQHFARALSNKDYVADATEWYYKSLQTNAKNFEAAQELIDHLVKNELHVEALSVIGHYNMVFPKTQKTWAKKTAEVKEAYKKYNQQYNIKEITIAGINKFLHAPVQFSNSSDTQIFLVDPESDFMTVDLAYLEQNGVSYKDLGEKEVMATNGRYLKGTQIVLDELNVGPFKLKNVKGMACENCAFLLGKTVMKRLNSKLVDNKGIKYITLKQ